MTAVYLYLALEVVLFCLFVAFVTYTVLAPLPADRQED